MQTVPKPVTSPLTRPTNVLLRKAYNPESRKPSFVKEVKEGKRLLGTARLAQMLIPRSIISYEATNEDQRVRKPDSASKKVDLVPQQPGPLTFGAN